MKPIQVVTSKVTPLDRKNVDTDQIISKEFLTRIERTGFGQFVFYHWRFDKDGNVDESFILNEPRFKDSSILVANENFGCGSSREHAPWAIQDYGFDVVIAPSFADIFRNNCYKNGVLPIILQPDEVRALLDKGMAAGEYEVTIDLEQQTVTGEDGVVYTFEIDDYNKTMILNGWDEISLTLEYEADITAFEEKQRVYE